MRCELTFNSVGETIQDADEVDISETTRRQNDRKPNASLVPKQEKI